MATKIKETPVLYGEDAKRFLKAIAEPSPVRSESDGWVSCSKCQGLGAERRHCDACNGFGLVKPNDQDQRQERR